MRCTWKAFGIFYFRFAFLAFWLTDSLQHWHPLLPLPPPLECDKWGGVGRVWYILNIVPCKDDVARWHYFDIYLHLAAALFSPSCISNDPQLSFVDWLCALSVPLFPKSPRPSTPFVSRVLFLLCRHEVKESEIDFLPTHSRIHTLYVVWYTYVYIEYMFYIFYAHVVLALVSCSTIMQSIYVHTYVYL